MTNVRLVIGAIYTGKGPRRAIIDLSDNWVEYEEEHTLTHYPLRTSVEDFLRWAEKQETGADA